MKIALTCIAKNEDNYIEEWVNYHLKLGFDKVFIYENNWKCNFENDGIQKIDFKGEGVQLEAYNDFIKNRSDGFDWVAFFDVDEFLVLKKHKNVKDFIQEYAKFDAIGINWVLFGDNGLSFDGNYSLLNRFTKRQRTVNQHVKCILKCKKNFSMNTAHSASNIKMVDTNLNLFLGPFNPSGTDDIAQLNHYFCKTREEWASKRSRGRASVSSKSKKHIRPDSDFDAHNFNEVEDKSALEFYLS